MGEIITIVLPDFLVLAFGYILGRWAKINADDMSRTAMLVLLPCMFFNSVVSADMDNSIFFSIILLCLILIAVYILVTYIICRYILKYSYNRFASIAVASSVSNSGIFGIPIIMHVFGPEGVAITVIFGMMQNVFANTVTVFLGSRGKFSSKEALLNVVKLPAVYGILVGITLKLNHIAVPEVVTNTTELIGGAAIPILILALGIYLAGVEFKKVNIRLVNYIVLGKYLLYPAIGAALIPLFYDWNSLAAKISLLCCFGPGPLLGIVVARLYGCDEDNIVNVGIFATSVLSVPLIGLILYFML